MPHFKILRYLFHYKTKTIRLSSSMFEINFSLLALKQKF